MLLEICLAVIVSTIMNITPVAGQDVGKTAEQVGVDVGVMVGQVVEDYLSGCHLVLITTAPHSLITSNILRHLCESGEARVVVGAGWMFSQDHLLPGLWGDARTTCRGLILDLTYTNNTDLVLRFLEEAELWKLPETLVLVVGGKAGVMEVLLHHSLHNTIHALYLALHDLTIHHLTLETLPLHTPLRNLRHRKPVAQGQYLLSGGVWVYRRCLYCNSGEADVQLLHLWNLTSVTQLKNDLFQEQFLNFWNTKMQFSALVKYPFMDYKADSDEPGSTVTLKNGLDARLLFLFAKRLNISFEIREQPERSYGMQKNGSFTGMVGQLQREEADICGPIATIAERIPSMDFLSYNRVDPLTIVSLRPTLLPQLLSLSKPLSRELWLSLLACVTVWGVILWLLQKVWWWLTGKRGVNFVSILLYGWGALLANLPSDPSVNKAGKVLVGVWLMFCLVITTGYTSSLVAHLSVQGKTKPPETFEDLVTLKNWKWGIETPLLTGAVLLYFSQHTDPVIQKVYKEMDTLLMAEGLKKVRAGGFSFICVRLSISLLIDSQYNDSYGQNPYYLSNLKMRLLSGFGWGFRKGAPFSNRFMQLMFRLQDAGVINRWVKEVVAQSVRENKAAAALNPQANTSTTPYVSTSDLIVIIVTVIIIIIIMSGPRF
ncbi:glutamate receptor-like [Cherax quadricarinatus]|uniref:glutamate receptor-like n=1 Tax=Cherax quadricarinatus TaxID=27406 RepID=UPI00387E6C45